MHVFFQVAQLEWFVAFLCAPSFATAVYVYDIFS